MKAHDIFGEIPRQLRDHSKPESDAAKKVHDGGTWKTKAGQSIIAESFEAFDDMRKHYFPEIPAVKWVRQ